jgi:hypothetical protein
MQLWMVQDAWFDMYRDILEGPWNWIVQMNQHSHGDETSYIESKLAISVNLVILIVDGLK